MTGPRYWLVLAVLLCCAARAQPPGPAQAPPVPPAGRSQTAAPAPAVSGAPDEELIEFLGEDDHGEGDWEEFLKRAQHGTQNATPPPPGAKQS